MRATPSSGYPQPYRRERRKTALASSLKATRRRETDDDPIAGLKRAQDDYRGAKTGFRNRQRQILQDVFRHITDLIEDDDACDRFMKRALRRPDMNFQAALEIE